MLFIRKSLFCLQFFVISKKILYAIVVCIYIQEINHILNVLFFPMSSISQNLTSLIQTPAYFGKKIPRVVDLDRFTVPEDSE